MPLTPDEEKALANILTKALAEFSQAPQKVCPVPLKYTTRIDRDVAEKPTLTAIGPAGTTILDPTFGTEITRITDGGTFPTTPNVSFRTPSNLQMRAWSADGKQFYVTSTWGSLIPFDFDPTSGKATPKAKDLRGVSGEPDFHPLEAGVIICPHQTDYQIWRRNINTGEELALFNLQGVATFDLGNPRTYVGGCGINQLGNRVFAFFGGGSQDAHFLLAVFDVDSGQYMVLDTMKGTLNGTTLPPPVNGKWGWHIHGVTMDRSGRFIKITARGSEGNWGPYWDIDNQQFYLFPSPSLAFGGHEAFGWGIGVNQAAGSPWDSAQWQLRALDMDGVQKPQALINPVLSPQELYLADHSSWHNSQPDFRVPFISGLYRYPAPNRPAYPWRAWDDEIVAVQTDVKPGDGAIVWRLAHHRSDLTYESPTGVPNYSAVNFWAEPHPQVSPDGRWVLFTSNWERTLGKDAHATDGTYARQDVFLLKLS